MAEGHECLRRLAQLRIRFGGLKKSWLRSISGGRQAAGRSASLHTPIANTVIHFLNYVETFGRSRCVLGRQPARASTPRQAADHPAGASSGIKSRNQNHESPSAPSVSAANTDQSPASNWNSGKQEQDAQNSIVVRELPPVTVITRRDLADWGYWAFSGLLVMVSALQVWLLWKTLGAVTRQADLMHQSLVATFRPKLIVRKISLEEGDQVPRCSLGDSGEIIPIPDLNPWKVKFEFSNIGQGTAHILGYSFAISRLEKERATDVDYMEGDAEPESFSLEPGEARQLSIDMGGELVSILRHIGADGLAKGYQNTDHIFFFGAAHYTDDLGTTRNIEACRHYDNASTRFKVVDDPDREYSD